MPSSLPAADHDSVDLEHLQRTTFGDAGLEREVLTMFVMQAVRLVGRLGTLPPDAGALAHTLKGAARAIGAFRVADCSAALEAAIRDSGDPSQALTNLNAAVAQACAAINAILDRA
jgi:HPt (histidine-containing phosphotransfer) domain-containing protein